MAEQINDNQERSIRDAVQQFVDEQIDGQEPDIDEFVRKYPEFEHQIRQRISNVHKVDALFASLTQAEEGDFEDGVTGDDLVGQRIANFDIVEMIGCGGMGVVYLARDTKLDRSVAIKSMPAKLTGDSTTRMRFKREAKLLASLNHPNIAAIHDIIEQNEGAEYLILEYVPGETLAERIAREPLTLAQTFSIGQQVAEAISAAHENGVVHRDLKPGNIKITPEGQVKVLDFGLAKTSVSEGRRSETDVTQVGHVIGTPAYMSPEQACSKPTDKRSDIWSFGCLMYEMLTGARPFEAETTTGILARIIEREPDWEKLPQETPENIRVLLRRCLEKDPHRRLRDIGDANLEISETLSQSTTAQPVTSPAKSRKMAMIICAAIIIPLTVIVVRFVPEEPTGPASTEIRLVVLPFENLGSTEDEYFADGTTGEIISRLSAIRTLAVISRTSAIHYKNSNKTIRQIGQELEVEYVLEGTVRWERPSEGPNRVRVTPQLIRVSDDTNLWSDHYDEVLANVFQIQSNIAERVAEALDIAILEPERRVLQSRPTENAEAYDYYLRGNDYLHRGEAETNFRIAVQMYEKAVELDSTFDLAYTSLSEAHVGMYWFYYDRSDARLVLAKQAVDRAFELNPGLTEAHVALGYYYYHGLLDYENALEQFAIARQSQPNNSTLISGIGWVQRRQGKFEQALVNIKKACELDPRSARRASNVGRTCMLLRKYAEAELYYNRAILLAPDWPAPHAFKAWLYLRWKGNTDDAWAVLKGASHNIGSVEDPLIVLRSVLLNIFDKEYEEALTRLSSGTLETLESQFYFIPKAQLYAQINGLLGNRQLEQGYYRSAESIIKSKIQERPEDARFHSSLGIACAGLGRKQDAIREGRLAVELLPVTKDAWRGTFRVEDLARIYVMVDEDELAIEQLEDLLTIPGGLSPHLLRLDPIWDPLFRDYPGFEKLLEGRK